MHPPVYDILAADADVAALLGMPPGIRLYGFGIATQLTKKPYAVWQMITGVPANYLDKLPDTDDERVQIDVWSETEAASTNVSRAIRDALEPHAYMINSLDRGRDPDTKTFGYTMEFEFFTPR